MEWWLRITLIELENGTTVVMTYDSTYGRLESLTNYASNGTTVLTSFDYTYNLDGYVTEVERENGYYYLLLPRTYKYTSLISLSYSG